MKVVASGDIHIASSGAVWGAICVEHEGKFFPGPSWEDLLLGVLDNWGVNIVRLLFKSRKSLKFWFFDGRVYFVCKLDGSKLYVTYAEDASYEGVDAANVAGEISCNAHEFFQSYIDVSGAVLKKLRNMKLSSRVQLAEGASIINIQKHRKRIKASMQWALSGGAADRLS